MVMMMGVITDRYIDILHKAIIETHKCLYPGPRWSLKYIFFITLFTGVMEEKENNTFFFNCLVNRKKGSLGLVVFVGGIISP